MSFIPLVSASDALKLGPGDYVIHFTGAGAVAVGVNWSALTMFSGQVGQRLYVTGPFYVKEYGSTSVQLVQVPVSESASPAAASGGGHEPPNLGG